MKEEHIELILGHIEQIQNMLYWEEIIIALYGEAGKEVIRIKSERDRQ